MKVLGALLFALLVAGSHGKTVEEASSPEEAEFKITGLCGNFNADAQNDFEQATSSLLNIDSDCIRREIQIIRQQGRTRNLAAGGGRVVVTIIELRTAQDTPAWTLEIPNAAIDGDTVILSDKCPDANALDASDGGRTVGAGAVTHILMRVAGDVFTGEGMDEMERFANELTEKLKQPGMQKYSNISIKPAP